MASDSAVGVRLVDSDSRSIIETVERLSNVTVSSVGDPNSKDAAHVPYAIVPKDKRIESLKPIIDQFRTKPERRTGTAAVTTASSFVQHVDRFSSGDTVIFADIVSANPSLLAVYDYNPEGPDVEDAAFGRHRARYQFPLSVEWQAWRAKDGEALDATAFAAFLEDRIQDVVAVDLEDTESDLFKFAMLVGGMYASPSQLLELSRSLSISAAVSVKQAQTLSSGEINVAYSEIHEDGHGRPIKVPNLFVIGIPVFRDGARYKIACRLRYRLAGGRITWWYTLASPELYFDDAVKEVCSDVASATGRPVLFGQPEAAV